ncbi:glycosyltransferase family 4 protein [Alloiococcus sp. CFN-8]|uniref:glycosyltransferase family 4 protein n=1 Tax=Alloiococcus sp. CFN-8 TaxID=3416081 RepID=UPI003CFA2BC3
MRITFYSNFLNHHQLPFCKAMVNLIGEGFTFVATEPIKKERLMMGYADINKEYSFVLRTYDGENEYKKARLLALESDVVILGSAPNEYIDIRIKQDKLTFKYAERFFKRGTYRRFIPTTRKKIVDGYVKYKKNNLYILSASAFTSYDLSLCGFPENKCLKWGYFPEAKKQNLDDLFKKKSHDVLKFLWVGRLIDIKRTKDAIEIAKKIKKDGYSFSLDIIGNGNCEESLKCLVNKYGLSDCVKFLGSMSPEKVRENMESANIFLFTSNFQEGWGAVLNEAMNSGCAVVASHAIGSVPYLLENGKNGLIYRYGDIDDFYNKVKYIMDNPQKRRMYGESAYYTLINSWNANVAAERLLNISKELLNSKSIKFYDYGPCSASNIINNKWFNELRNL